MSVLLPDLSCRFAHACLYLQDGPEDDDSWMTGGAADLEAELAQRQKELEGNVAKHAKRTAQGLGSTESAPEFDPSDMVSKLNVSSGHMHSSLLQCYAVGAMLHSAWYIHIQCKTQIRQCQHTIPPLSMLLALHL